MRLGLPSRHSIRLPEYDYSEPGAYFVTINCHKHRALFGSIENEAVNLNNLGEIASKCWSSIPKHFSAVTLDTFLVMPSHVHGILFINETPEDRVGAQHAAPSLGSIFDPLLTDEATANPKGVRARHASPLPKPRGARSGSLGAIVGSYKSAVTRAIHQAHGYDVGIVWHRNYYEHVVRNQRELESIRRYITYNPLKSPNLSGNEIL